jgi:hypothetical protein
MPINEETVEIRVRGRWVKVPALTVNGEAVIASGKWLRVARVRGEEMMEGELKRPEQYIELLKGSANERLGADVFTFTQKVQTTQPKYPYPQEQESIAAIRLEGFNEWWESLPQETRKNVRRASKRGVVVKIEEFDDALVQGIRAVNDDSPIRQGLPNAYYGKSSEETKRLYGDFLGRCDFICAYSGEELIGFLHLVYCGQIASILNLTTKRSHFDKRPANSLMATAVQICEAKGISHITYGGYNYGNKTDSPLREFKIRCGFVETLVPRYYVPLTKWGALCVKAGLHRGVVGILPHPIITLAVRLRSMWYEFSSFMRRCSSMLERPNRTRQMERSNPPAGSNSSPQSGETSQ